MKRFSRIFILFFVVGLTGFWLFGCSDDSPSGPDTDTTPPPPPTNLEVTQEQLGLRLDWDIPLDNDEPVPDLRGYNVYRDPSFTPAGKIPTDSSKADTPELDDYIFVLESNYFDRSVTEGESYSYSITAVDDSLNESEALESDIYMFDNRAPLVTITSPVTGFVTNVPSVTVEGTVIDSQQIGTANIYVNDAVAGQATVNANGTFSTLVSLIIGQNSVKAEATDGNGNVGQSSTVSVTYDTSTVAVQITSPEDDFITQNQRIAVTGTVSDPAITEANLIVNGAESTIDVTGGQFDAIADLDEGANTIRVRAQNPAGTAGTSPTITVTRDTTDPTVFIVQPIDQTPFQDTPILVSGSVSDANPPDSVSVSVGGAFRKVVLLGGQYQVYMELQEGTNQITVSAIDDAGNLGSATVTVYLNSFGPTVRITTPQDGALLNDPEVDIGGTVTDPNISTGNLFVDGVPQIISIDRGIFLVSVTLTQDGDHMFWAEVVDEYERPGVSDTVNVILDTTPPSITITSPADSSKGNSPSISVAGQVDDEEVESVTVFVGSYGVEASVVGGAFSTQVTLSEGWNTIYAEGSDLSDNVGQSDMTHVLLDTQAEIDEVDHDAAGVTLEIDDHVLFWLDAEETGGTASVDIEDVHENIRLYDDGSNGDDIAGDGVYKRDYTIQATDEATNAQVIGHFTDHVGNEALDQVAPNTITINVPPGAVTLFNPAMTEVTSSGVNLKWTATTSPDFQDYQLYRDTSPGVNTLSTLVTTITEVGQDTVRYSDKDASLIMGTTYYYRVYVRDQLGASIGSNEINATLDSWPSEQTLIIPADFPAYMAKIDNGSGRYVALTQMSNPGAIKIINHVTDGIVKSLDVEGRTVGITINPYVEFLAAGFDQNTVYRVHGYNLDLTEPDVQVGSGPWDVACGWGPGDTLYAFTATGDNDNSADDSVSVVNLWTGNLDYTFHTGGIHYSHMGSSPGYDRVYLASPWGTLATINPLYWSIDGVYGGFREIFDMIVTNDRIYLLHRDDDRLSVLSRWNLNVERELTVNGGPGYCVEIPGSPYLYVSCMDNHTVAVFNTTTWELIDRISVATPLCVLPNDAGDKVYVSRLAGQGGVVVLEY